MKKVVICFTDGADNASSTSLKEGELRHLQIEAGNSSITNMMYNRHGAAATAAPFGVSDSACMALLSATYCLVWLLCLLVFLTALLVHALLTAKSKSAMVKISICTRANLNTIHLCALYSL